MIVRTIEEGGQTITLRKQGDRYDVVLGQVVILSSAALETERAFGALVGEIAPGAKRVLVGGLGFGATVRGVLDACEAPGFGAGARSEAEARSPNLRVEVVEKLEAICDLARGELSHLAGRPLDDPRVTLVRADVSEVIAAARGLDAILLDVDNGPDWASFRSNARLYAAPGLEAARAALAPGGVLAVWSGYPADAFLGKLRAAGFAPRVVLLRERGVVRARAYVGAVTASTP
jgi:spermidine synthase